MKQLIRIEWLKIRKYPAFWGMLGIVLLSYPAINSGFFNVYLDITRDDKTGQMIKMFLGNPFAFPEAFHTIAFFSSFFVVLPAILVIMLITNEVQYRTHRQNIIDGWERKDFMWGKFIDVFLVTLTITLVYFLVCLGFGLYMDPDKLDRMPEQLHYVPLFFLQSFGQLSIAFMLGYLIRKAFIAMGIFMFYTLIGENMLAGYLRYKKIPGDRFLPVEAMDQTIVVPAFIGNFGKDGKAKYLQMLEQVPEQVVITLVYTVAIWGLCFFLHNRRDLN
ncbi:MAG: hypothetical protein EAZ62_08820 [Sphingobacteriia bacterium]|nr:MAG: hypothetical protein EAZ62_08820 [Sphingobacteriia bacterium]